jgi:hypothetical protein
VFNTICRTAVASAVVAVGVLLAVGPASAVSAEPSATAKASCARTEVTLHTNGSPSMRCLTPVRASIAPLAGTDTSCPTDDLVLYWNGPIGVSPNYTLCVNGSGLLNLNQNFYGLDWNDEASAWWTGCRDVYFFVDINEGGDYAFEYGSYLGENAPSGIFPDQGVGNDQLSSVYLAGSHGC